MPRSVLIALSCLILGWGLPLRAAHAQQMWFEHLHSFGERIDRSAGATNYPSGVAADPNSGHVYVMDLLFNRIQKFDEEGRFVTMWEARQPLGLTVDPTTGNLWAAFWKKHKVVLYDPNGEVLNRLGTGQVGDGPGEFNQPHDLTVDPRNGDLYVLDSLNKRVQVFSRDGQFKREFAGPFIQPFGIAIHPEGEFLAIANTANREILKMSLDGKVLARWKRKGSGPGQFRWPRGVAVDADGFIYVADTDNERAQKLDSDGNFVGWVLGPNDRKRGAFHPRAIDVNYKSGDVYAAAAYAHRIDRFNKQLKYLSSFGQHSRKGPVFNTLKGVTVNPKTQQIYVSDWMDHQIKRFDAKGKFQMRFDLWIPEQTDLEGNPLPADFADNPETRMWISKEYQGFPGSMALDAEGDVWVIRGSMHYDDDPRLQADWLVREFSPDGKFKRGFGHRDFPRNARMRSLAIDQDDKHVVIANSFGHRLMKFTMDGNLVWSVGDKGEREGQFNFPSGVAIDQATGEIYVVDANNHRIQVFDTDGSFLRAWGEEGDGEGQFNFTDFSEVAFDPKGYVFVADSYNHRVQVFDKQGKFVAKYGEQGFGGEGRYTGFSGIDVHDGKMYVGDNAGYEVEVYQIHYP